jgi:hypothetical protein
LVPYQPILPVADASFWHGGDTLLSWQSYPDHLGAGLVEGRAVEVAIKLKDLESTKLQEVLHLPSMYVA